jgi:hypothetical protein
MKPWWKVVRPKQDIIDGDNVDLGVFAIHLDQIANQSSEAPAVYRDPKLFFSNTVFTEGMMKLTRHVHDRLSGNTDGGSVIDLNTVFGGGKTHSLVHLLHLFGNGEKARKWLPKDSLDDLANQIRGDPIPAAQVLTWVGTNFSHNKPDENGMRTPWGQIFAQLGPKAMDKIKPFEKDKTRPDTDTIREILNEAGGPVLILLDEVLSAMESMRAVKVGETVLNDSFRGFYMNLTNVASSMKGVVIVNSFSKSVGNISEADEADLQLLQNVAGRLATPIQTAEGKEIAKIIQRRLFDDVNPADKKHIKQVVKEWNEWALANHDSITIDHQLGELIEAFEGSYPFHPRVLDVFEKKWLGLGSSFQRTRGVLRMLSLWIRRAYLDAAENNHKHPLIMLGHAPLHEVKFANTVYDQMGNDDLSIPINSDVAGDSAHARKLDEEAQSTIQKLALHRQIATAVFFESTGGHKMNHARTGEVKWGVCGPKSADLADVDTCLKNLENRGHYFRTKNDAHHISTKANLNKLILDEKATIEDRDVTKLIEDTAMRQLGKSTLISVKPNVRYAEDVPDALEFQLCMIPFDVLPGSEEHHAEDVALRILTGGNRTYKRHLAFISCADNVRLKTLARNHLTYKSIKNKSSTYQLDQADKAEIPAKVRSSLEDLMDEVWNCYRTLHLGESDGTLSDQSGILGLINRSMNSEGIAHVVAQRFADRDTIVTKISHRVTEKWPPAFKEEDKRKPWTLQSLRDNVFQSSEASASRLTTADGLKSSINEWVKSGKVVLVGVNADGSMGEVLTNEETTHIELSVLVKFDDSTGILLPSDIPAGGEETEHCSKCGEKVCSCVEPVSETCEKCGKDPCSCTEPPPPPPPIEDEEVEMTFTVPAKKLNSIGMAMSMNFDDATAKIEFKGKPRKGTGSNPVSALKDAINSAGGEIED